MPEPVRVPLPPGARLAAFGTAYALSTRAHAVLASEDGAPVLELWARDGADPEGLAEEALLVFANQRLRWQVAERGAAVKAELARRMLALARRAGRPAAAATLPAEAAARLAAVLAETGEAERDPRGIKTVWSDLRRKA